VVGKGRSQRRIGEEMLVFSQEFDAAAFLLAEKRSQDTCWYFPFWKTKNRVGRKGKKDFDFRKGGQKNGGEG